MGGHVPGVPPPPRSANGFETKAYPTHSPTTPSLGRWDPPCQLDTHHFDFLILFSIFSTSDMLLKLESASNVRIGLKCTDLHTFEADLCI